MKRPSRRQVLRGALVLALMGLPYLLLRIPTARTSMVQFVGYVRAAGPVGALALVGFYGVWALVAGPFWVMGVVAGYVYGFVWGFLLGTPLVASAMTLAFVFARFVVGRVLPPARDESPQLAAIRRAVGANGFKVVLLLRMTPVIPQNALTYVLAGSPVRVRDFAAATALGAIPFTLFYVYVGSLVDDAAALLRGETPDLGAARWVALGVSLVGGLVALVVLGRIARRALDRVTASSAPG